MSTPFPVFLPGNLCDERVWLPVWRQLSWSQRAYVPLQWANSLDDMLALTRDRVESCPGPVHLIGFSMGGYIAACYAAQSTQNIARVTLIGYSPEGLTEAETSARKQLLTAIDTRKYRGMSPARLGQFIHNSHRHNPEVSDTVKAMETDLGAAVLRAHVAATTPRPSMINKLAALACPVHFIAARDDQIAPLPAIQRAQQQIAGSTLDVIDDAGHMMLLENPRRLAEALVTATP